MCKAWLAAVCAGIGVFSSWADFVWPEGTGDVTIPAGETVEVTDISVVDAHASVTVEKGATLRFNTATPPTTALKGTGAIEKTSADAWTLTQTQTGFSGHFWIKNGTITTAKRQVFGIATSALYVTVHCDGGTLIIPNETLETSMYQYERLCLKGTGYEGQGALVINKGTTNGSQLQYVSLDGDALISVNKDYIWTRGKVTLNGHALTYGGTVTGTLGYAGSTFVGPGEVVIAEAESKTMRHFLLRGVSTTYFNVTDPLTRVTLEPNTGLSPYDDGQSVPKGFSKKLQAELVVATNGVSEFYHQHRVSGMNLHTNYSDHVMEWSGPIVLCATGSVLRFTANYAGVCQTVVSGPISGPGGIATGTSSSGLNNRLLLTNPTNSFAGASTLYFTQTGSLALDKTNAVPDYSKLTVSNGRVALQVPDEDSPWTPNEVTRLANEVTWTNNAALTFDSLETEGAPREFSLAGWNWNETMTNANAAIGVERGSTLVVPGPLTRTNRFAIVGGGTVKFTGDERIDIGDMFVSKVLSGDLAGKESHFVFENASDVHTLTQAVKVGSADVTRMILRNAKIACGNPDGQGATTSYSILLGNADKEKAVLELDATSVISNRVHVGYTSGSVGAVYQRGGTVLNRSGTYDQGQTAVYPSIGRNGYGYWEVTENGILDLQMRPMVGSAGPGTLYVDGGTVRVPQRDKQTSNSWLYLSRNGGSGAPGAVYVRRGKVDLSKSDCYTIIGYAANWRASITVDGPESVFDADHSHQIGWSGGGGGKLHINMLDGGLFRTTTLARRSDVKARTNPDRVYVNFNGGILKTTAAADPFPEYVSSTNNYLFTVNVYENGATLDTNGKSLAISKPFLAPPGNGVQSIPMPDEVANGTFIAPPVIVIANAEGDETGDGATAQALFDSKTGKVTGIRVTARGFDYTQPPVAKFYMGNIDKAYLIASVDCVIGSNVSGSFTKAGTGTLTLNATNTWQGATVLAGGTLKLGVDNAIPATTTFVLAGGALDMNGKTLGDGAVTAMGACAVDVAEALAGNAGTYAAEAFAEGATLTVLNVAQLPDFETARSVTLLTISGTVPAGFAAPAVDGELPEGWQLRWVGNVLKAIPQRGTMLLVR